MNKIELLTKPYFFSLKNKKIILSVFCALCFLSFKVAYLNANVIYSARLQAKELAKGNLLNWETSYEKGVKHFHVEKSINGVEFESIGIVESKAAKSEENKYFFFDTKLGTLKSYYRLKVVENDGAASYSQTILVNRQLPNEFAVVAYSSVRTKTQFELTLDAVTEGQLEYALVSHRGELIYEEFQYIYPGLNDIQISLQDLPEGVYKVKLKLEKEEEYLIVYKVNDGQKSNVPSSQKIKKN